MNADHTAKTTSLQTQIADYYSRRVPFRVYHGSTNSTRILSFKRSEMVDTSSLTHILSVDGDNMTVIAEPNVAMDKLVKATLKQGFVPPVVPEFPGITVGGAVQGTAAESASHRWGCFSQTIKWLEVILGDGTLMRVSPTEHSDLFYGMAGAYGSLGLITAVAITLIPATKYVQVTHYPIVSSAEGVKLMREYAAAGYDFIEWVMFTKTQGTVVIGTMSNEVVGELKRFSRPFDPWYYLYARATADAGQTITDTLPLKDYLFRFNRGAFWAAELAFTQSSVPFNAFTRFLLDPLLRTRKLYQALQTSAASQEYICQDLVVPIDAVLPFMEFIDREFQMYPVGGCPIKPEPRSPLQCNGIDTDMVVNIGVYGLRIRDYDKFKLANRQIEAETHRLGGKKWLYAYNFYTEQEFWKIYDKQWYTKLRQKYHATSLPDIFKRTRVTGKHQVNKRRGALKAALGLAKLRIQD